MNTHLTLAISDIDTEFENDHNQLTEDALEYSVQPCFQMYTNESLISQRRLDNTGQAYFGIVRCKYCL